MAGWVHGVAEGGFEGGEETVHHVGSGSATRLGQNLLEAELGCAEIPVGGTEHNA